ncbi:MAG: spore protease YyaC [Veillonellales bacterium]
MEKNSIDKLTVNLTQICAHDKLYHHLRMLLVRQEGVAIRPLVFLCIGSDRYTGDALGPLIGSYLQEHTGCLVYGSLDHPVHAGNLVETVHIIHCQQYHPIIVAIDACLGKPGEIGNIEVWEGGLQAGIAVGNHLPQVGNISIIGVVNSGGRFGYLDLQSTPLSLVMKLTKMISGAVEKVIHNLPDQTEVKMLLG